MSNSRENADTWTAPGMLITYGMFAFAVLPALVGLLITQL